MGSHAFYTGAVHVQVHDCTYSSNIKPNFEFRRRLSRVNGVASQNQWF